MTTDLIVVTAGVGAVFSAVCVLVAAFAEWPRAGRHVAERQPGADVATPPAPWRTSTLADTRPLHRDGAVEAPPLPARLWACGLCRDGREVVGAVCVWCGARPAMQP